MTSPCLRYAPLMTPLDCPPHQVLLQKEVASALWSMSFQNGPNQKAIAKAGGVPLLIGLLSKGSPEMHRDAAGALWSLAADHAPNQQLIFECGGIIPLVALLQPGGGLPRDL